MNIIEEEIFKESEKIKKIWNSKETVIAVRDGKIKNKIKIKIPFDTNNFEWLKNNRRNNPKWSKKYKCWLIPKAWFNDFINRALEKWGYVYIIQPYREQEKCSISCMKAKNHDCQCSCKGKNHGQGNESKWFHVNEAFCFFMG